MTKFPLVYRFRTFFANESFSVGVVISGRALATFEDEECWLYGVQPGAIAESGADLQDAYFSFRRMLFRVLLGYFNESETFEDFYAAAKTFLEDQDAAEFADWQAAATAVRQGEKLPEPFSKLPMLRKEMKDEWAIWRLDQGAALQDSEKNGSLKDLNQEEEILLKVAA